MITKAARRIAKAHNARIQKGFAGNGFLVFGRDGSGGAWYSENSCPDLSDLIKISLAWHHLTAADVQETIDFLETQSRIETL